MSIKGFEDLENVFHRNWCIEMTAVIVVFIVLNSYILQNFGIRCQNKNLALYGSLNH